MKNLNFSRLTLMCIVFLTGMFAGCKKEEDNDITAAADEAGIGTASLAGAEYSTPYGYVADLGNNSNSTIRNFVLDLANGTYNGAYSSNTTTVITFDLYSSTSDKISAGTYTFNSSSATLPLSFEDAYAHFNLVYNNGNFTGGNRYENPTEGTLTINYSGDEAIITYSVNFQSGEILLGSYTGKLKYYTV